MFFESVALAERRRIRVVRIRLRLLLLFFFFIGVEERNLSRILPEVLVDHELKFDFFAAIANELIQEHELLAAALDSGRRRFILHRIALASKRDQHVWHIL